MIAKLKVIFGIKPSANFKELLKDGGIIIDVRSTAEFANGHIQGSKNMPLQTLSANSKLLNYKNTPIITCCASGMRSASAKSLLKSEGFTQVYNGGSWTGLNTKI